MREAKLIPNLLAENLNSIIIKQSKKTCLSVSTLLFYSRLKELLVAL